MATTSVAYVVLTPAAAEAAFCSSADDPACGLGLPAAEQVPYCYVTEAPVTFEITYPTWPPSPISGTAPSAFGGTYTYPGGGTGTWRMTLAGNLTNLISGVYHSGPTWGINNSGQPFWIFYGATNTSRLVLSSTTSPASSENVTFSINADAEPYVVNGVTYRNRYATHTNSYTPTGMAGGNYYLSDPNNYMATPTGVYPAGTPVNQTLTLNNFSVDTTITSNSNQLTIDQDGGSAFEGGSMGAVAKYTSCLTVTKTGAWVDSNGNGYADVGDTIKYTYVVTNPGTASQTGVSITDAGVTMNTSNFALAPGASRTITGTYPLTAADISAGFVRSNATARATDLFGNVLTDLSDDPTVAANVDSEGDGEPDDPTTVTLPPPPIDLGIVKTDAIDPINYGATETYTLTITNYGPGAVKATDTITVLDTLPSGITSPTYTPPTGATYNPSTGALTGVAINVGSSITLKIAGTVSTSGTTITNTASVAVPSGRIDPVSSNNTTSQPTTINPRADLAITKTASPNPFVAGSTMTWTINVVNNGPNVANSVTLTDVIPSTVTGATVTGCTFSGSTCSLGNLAAGASKQVTIAATVPAGAAPGSTITNTASVATTSQDLVPSNNQASVSTSVKASADVVVLKTSSPSPFVPGQPITYTFTVQNNGPSVATGVTLADTFPAALTGIATSQSGCTVNGQQLDCALGTLGVGAANKITFTATANTPSSATSSIVNTAKIGSATPDPNTANNTSTNTNGAAPKADLRITKTDLADPVIAGQTITYQITVSNLGPSDATNVYVADDFGPASLGLYQLADPDLTGANGSCAGYECWIDVLAPGATAIITLKLQVPPDADTSLQATNTAKTTSDVLDPDGSNNEATETTDLIARADLSITKTGDPAGPIAGQSYTYTLKVVNGGPSAISGTTVTDTLPAGMTFNAASSPECSVSGQDVTCVVGPLGPGDGQGFDLVVDVDPGVTGSLSNTAEVAPAPGVTDPNLNNNTATAAVSPEALADLSVSKSVSTEDIKAGDSLTWTILVTNNGPSVASAVVLEDVVPSGVTITSISPSSCPSISSCTLGDFQPGQTLTLTVEATVDPSIAEGEVLVNEVTVASPTKDPDESNNGSGVKTVVHSVADVGITKTADPDPFTPGGPLTFRVNATNAGPSTATYATFIDPLPSAFQYSGYTVVSGVGSCDYDPGAHILKCQADSLSPGDSFIVDIEGTTDPTSLADIDNGVELGSPSTYTDPEPSNDVAKITVAAKPDADLGVTKTPDGEIGIAGLEKKWTITVTSGGPTTALNTIVKDVLPNEVSFVWAEPSIAGAVCNHDGSATGGVLTCELGDVPPGEIVTIDVITVIAPSIAPGTEIKNEVGVSSDVNDSNPTNNDAAAVIKVEREADLTITKLDNPDPLIAGEAVTWTITVDNIGPSDADDVVVSDVVPDGFTIVSTSPAGVCSGAPDLTCSLGTLTADAAPFVITVEATSSSSYVADGKPNPAFNTAKVDSPNESNPDNNAATSSTLLYEKSNVKIAKSAPEEVAVGSDIEWTIEVKNDGPSVASDVIVIDSLPEGVVVDPAAIVGATCNLSGLELICELGTLGAGESVLITIIGNVGSTYLADGNPDIITNKVDVKTSTPESDTGDNSTGVDTKVTEIASLAVKKDADRSPVNAGETMSWKITVYNDGPAAARDVVLTDAAPPEFTITAISADNGGPCSLNGECSLGTIGVGAEVIVTVTGTVASSFVGTLTNTAKVDAATPDDDYSDNAIDATVDVVTAADLELVKTGPVTVVPGEPVSYTVVVTNLGPSDALNTALDEALPPELLDPSITVAGDGCTASCTVGTLSAGESITFIVEGTLDPAAVGPTITNTATITADTTDPNPSNNTDAVDSNVAPLADVSVTKSDLADPVTAGDELAWTLTANNAGPSVATGVVISDTLPNGVTLVSAPGCTGTTVLSCPVGSLAPGADATVTVTVTVDASYSVDGLPNPLSNTASVTTATPENNSANNVATETTTIASAAGLSIGKDVVESSATAGENVTWKITVTNAGPSAASDVVVTDTLANGTTLVSATFDPSQSCDAAGQSISCDLGTIAAGGSVVITVEVAVDEAYVIDGLPNPIVNTASVTTSTPEADLSDNTATSSVPVADSADLSIAKVASATVVAGNQVTWTLTVTNNGPSVARSITIDDPAPAGVTVDSVSLAGCTLAVECQIASLAPGETGTVTIVGTVDADWFVDGRPTSLDNDATITSVTPDSDPGNNGASATTQVTEEAKLAVTKTASPEPVIAGETVTWVVSVSNTGPSAAREVAVSDPAPTGITIVSATASTGDPCTLSVSCTLAVIEPDTVATVTITGLVSPAWFTDRLGDTLANTVSVTTPTNPDEVLTATSESSVDDLVDLSVVKSDGGATALAGGGISWTIGVTNSGPSDAPSVLFTDAVPSGLDLSTVVANVTSPASGTCDLSNLPTIACDLGTIAVDGSATVTISAVVDSEYLSDGLPSPMSNTASVSSTATDADSSNNTATDTTPIISNADLTIAKSGPTTASAGNALVWTVEVGNLGPSAATGVEVSDPIPAGMTIVSATPNCTIGSSTVDCPIPVLGVGVTYPITIIAAIDDDYAANPTATPVINRASVTSDVPDPDQSNNVSEVSTTIEGEADLSIVKTVDPTAAVAGEPITWTVTATNSGPSIAQDVEVVDALPAGFTLTSISAPSGVTCDATGRCLFGTVAVDAPFTFTIAGVIDSDVTAATLSNTAVVTSTTPDPDDTNNTSTVTATVATTADLAITKTGPASVVPGTDVTYDITVTNDGPSDALAVVVDEVLPTSLLNPTLTASTGTCSATSCDLGTIPVGQTTTITVTGTVDPATTDTTMTNTATVSSDTTDPDTGNNTAEVTSDVTAIADVSITKTDTLDPVVAGMNEVWTITVDNAGPSVARGVVVSDTLPAGVTFVDAPGCTVSTATPPELTCDVGDLAVDGTASFAVEVTVNQDYYVSGLSSPMSNTATVSTTTDDPDTSNNTATEQTTVAALAGVAIGKNADVSRTSAGSSITWTLTVLNGGPSDAENVVVTDPIPAGLAVTSATFNGTNCTIDTTAGSITCNLGTLAVYQSASDAVTITVESTVDPAYVLNGLPDPLENAAHVESTTTDPEPSDNDAADQVQIVAADDISVTKVSNPAAPDGVTAGESIEWTITVNNAGPSVAAAVELDDVVPAGVTNAAVTIDPALGTCDAAIHCVLTPLAVNTPITLTVTGTVDANWFVDGRGPTLTNTVTATDPTDTELSNNSATVDTPVLESAVLVPEKTASPDPVIAGEPIEWTITVRNDGPSAARDIVIDDPAPAGTTVTAATVDGALCTFAVNCTVPVLAVGATATVTITATVSPSWTTDGGGPTISNTATITTATNPGEAGTANVITDVTDSADVSLTKQELIDPVHPGTDVRWVIGVANNGPSDAAAIVLSDTLPAGLDPDSVTITPLNPEVVCDTGALPTFSCTLPGLGGVLAADAGFSVQIDATLLSTYLTDGLPAQLANTASVATSTTDPDATNNTATATTDVTALADVSVTKSVDPATVVAGENVVWTVQVANAGPSSATGVTATDIVPAGIVPISATTDLDAVPNCSIAAQTVMCPLDVMAVGALTTITITGTVDADYVATGQPSPITNSVRVTPTSPDTVTANNTASIDVAISENANLSIVKAAGADTAVAGEAFDWKITVRNAGPSVARSVTTADVVPTGYQVQSVSASNGATCDIAVTCQLGDLAPDEAVVISVTGTIDASYTAATMTNSATVSAATPDSDPTDNTSAASTSVTSVADVEVVKTGPATVTPGETATYSIAVTNNGPSTALAVSIADVLPAGFDHVSVTTTAGTCTTAVTCQLGTIAVGATETVEVTATLDPSVTAAELTNTVSAQSSTTDPNLDNNTSAVVSAVVPSADVRVAKDDVGDAVLAGSNVTWTITVTNDGPSYARAVVVNDPLPAGVTLVSTTGDCTGSISCTLGDLAPQQSVVITVVAKVDPGYLGGGSAVLVNAAAATSPTPDPDTSNNSGIDQTTVAAQAGLSIAKDANVASVTAGTQLQWTLTVTNKGPSIATDVVVSDTLAAGTTLVSATPSNATSCSGTAALTCNLGDLAVGQNVIIVVVVDVADNYVSDELAQPLVNAATVTSPTPDDTVTDNSAVDTVAVVDAADLSIRKTGPAAVDAGSTIEWDLTVTNDGPSIARNVSVADVAPAGVTITGATGATCTLAVGCDLGELDPGATVVIHVVGTVDSTWLVDGHANPLTNTATTTSDTADPNAADNVSTATTTITETAVLTSTKTVEPDPTVAGESVKFTIEVTNGGPSAAREVTIGDPPPAGITITSATVDQSGSCTIDVKCVVPTLEVGDTATVTIEAEVSASWLSDGRGSELANTATVTTATNPGESGTATATANVTDVADVSIIKRADETLVAAGTMIHWHLDVSNAGPSDARTVTITDTLPAGVSSIVVSPPTGVTCDTSALPAIECTSAVLPVGQTVTIDIGATVDASYFTDGNATPLANTADVKSDVTDPDDTNNSSTIDTQIANTAGVAIGKSATPNPVVAGESITWTLEVANAGPGNATAVTIDDPIPSGVTITNLSTTVGTCEALATIACTLGDLAPDSSALIVATGTVTDRWVADSLGDLANTATVATTSQDDDKSDNVASVTTSVTDRADLQLVKSVAVPGTPDEAGPAVAGRPIRWTLQLTNVGPSVSRSVTISDALPAGMTAASATSSDPAFTCAVDTSTDPAVVTCDGPELGVGGAGVTITIDATVDDDYLSQTGVATVANTATATGTTPDPSPATAGVETDVTESADLIFTKTAVTPVVVAGTTATWQLAVINNGPSAARDVVVTDPVPTALSAVTAVADNGATCDVDANNLVTCPLGELGAATTVVVTVSGLVDPGLVADGESAITNTASVATATPDPTPNPDATSTIDVVTEVNVGTTKADALDPVTAGTSVFWTIGVGNGGPSTAQQVVVTDTIPAGVRVASATASDGSPCQIDTAVNSVTCTFARLDLQPSRTVSIVGAVAADYVDRVGDPDLANPLTNPMVNTVTAISINPETDDTDNTATEPTTVASTSGLSISKEASAASVVAGKSLKYTITVVNGGPSTASDVVVSDPIPAGLKVSSVEAPAGVSCTKAVACKVASLAPGASLTVVVATVVDPAAVLNGITTLTNVAKVSSSTPDPIVTDNEASTTTAVSASADVSLTKKVSANVGAGGTLDWKLTVTNSGPSAAGAVVVSDPIAAGLTVTSATASNSASCTKVVECALGTLAPGASVTITIVTATQAGPGSASIKNTATVASATPDPTPGNNKSTATGSVLGAQLGLAKRVVGSPVNNEDGSFTITYGLLAVNSGDATLRQLQVTDDLATTFGEAASFSVVKVSSPSLTLNSAFDGRDQVNLLAGTDTLAPGTRATIEVTVQVKPAASGQSFSNSATATASPAPGVTLTDVSASGSEPDADGDGDPSNDDGPTQVSLAAESALNVTKQAGTPVAAGNAFEVVYTIVVANSGDVAIADVQVTDDLGQAFGEALNGVAEISGNGLEINDRFNGTSERALLAPGQSLAAGDQAIVTLRVSVKSPGAAVSYTNTAAGSGTDPYGASVAGSDTASVDCALGPPCSPLVTSTTTASTTPSTGGNPAPLTGAAIVLVIVGGLAVWLTRRRRRFTRAS